MLFRKLLSLGFDERNMYQERKTGSFKESGDRRENNARKHLSITSLKLNTLSVLNHLICTLLLILIITCFRTYDSYCKSY